MSEALCGHLPHGSRDHNVQPDGAQDAAAAAAAVDPAAADTAATAPQAEARRRLAFERRLISVGLCLHCATQMVALLGWSSLSTSERFQRCLSVVFSATLPLLTWLAPAMYLRRRTAILFTWRVGFFSFPLLRQARGESAVMNPGTRSLLRCRSHAKSLCWLG